MAFGISAGGWAAAPGRAPAPSPRAGSHKTLSVDQDGWYGIYFRQQKIGYSSIQTSPTVLNGRKAVRVDHLTWIQVKLMGTMASQEIDQTDVYRPDGAPLVTSFAHSSNGHGSRVLATYTPTAVNCVINDGSSRFTRAVPIPPGVKLTTEDESTAEAQRLRPGQSWTEWYFDPATLAVEKITNQVPLQPSTSSPGSGGPAADRNTLRIQTQSMLGLMTMIVDAHGKLVRMEMPMGIVMTRETRDAARGSLDYKPSADLAEIGSVASDAPLGNPRAVSTLELDLDGIPDTASIPTGDGQEAKNLGRGKWRLVITRTPAPARSVSLPEKAPAAALQATPELNASSPEMLSTANSILAGEKDAGKAVALLHDWVNQHMRARYDIAVMRSGLDVLHDREGVCRDYATLYGSLARAAGIPTRLCAGLVYWRGRFYYHAWAESYVGGWVRVDPTLPVESVDATHITLARGDVQQIYPVVSLVGRIRIHVVKSQSS